MTKETIVATLSRQSRAAGEFTRPISPLTMPFARSSRRKFPCRGAAPQSMKIAGYGGRVSSRSAELQLCALPAYPDRAELELRAPDTDRRGDERLLQFHFLSRRR